MPHFVEQFESPKDSSHKILLNLQDEDFYILREPTAGELRNAIEVFEQEVLEAFWTKLILSESPYVAGLPYGLACNSNGRNAVEWTAVYEKLTNRLADHAHAAGRFCRSQMREHLIQALRQLQPRTIVEAEKVLAAAGITVLKTPSMLSLLDQTPSFKGLLMKLWELTKKCGPGQRTAVNLLVRMRGEGWVLLPRNIVRTIGPIIRGLHAADSSWEKSPEYYLGPKMLRALDELESSKGTPGATIGESTEAQKRRFAVLCSSIRGKEDMSIPLVQALLRKNGASYSGSNALVGKATRIRWSQIAMANGPGAMQRRAMNDHRRALQERSPQDRLDDLKPWFDALEEECKKFTGGMMEPIYKPFGAWLTWVCTLDHVPLPLEVTREMVIGDTSPEENTFSNFLENREYKQTKDKNLPLSRMHKFFERLRIQEESHGRKFLNPIVPEFDFFRATHGEHAGRTHRERVPEKVMAQLKRMLVEDKGNGCFEWGKKVPDLTRIRGAFGNETDEAELGEFCPVLPAIIYLLLVYPLRTHHVRWLDSGEFDQECFDFLFPGAFRHNPKGLAGRAYGVIQPDDEDGLGGEGGGLLFQIAVNKVLLQERHKSYFTIPFLDPETRWVIQQVLDWQRKYGPPPRLVKEVHEPGLWQRRNQKMAAFYPEICPLFRYPGQRRGDAFPASHQQISYFWGKLCREWDIEHSEGLRPTGIGEPKCMAYWGHRTVDGRQLGGWWQGTFGLHCLRVANVSGLLDAGMPLALVAAAAGHKAIVMTFHYYREDRSHLRNAIHEAVKKRGTLAELEDLDHRLEEFQNYEDYLIGSKQGFEAMRRAQSKGNIMITLSGICPGTTCDTGLDDEYRSTHGGDVPGSKCALCKYRVYGPPFLPGLVLEMNSLLLDLRTKARHLSEQRDKAQQLEDSGETKRASLIYDELDLLDREVELDIKVLFRLNEMAKDSSEKADTGRKAADDRQTLTLLIPPEGREKVVTRLELASEFDLLNAIVQDAQILDATRHVAPTTAVRMLKDKFLRCLRQNGVEPYLLDLAPQVADAATIQLAKLLSLAVINADERQRILDGKVPISAVPGLTRGIKKLMVDAGLPTAQTGPHGQQLTERGAGFADAPTQSMPTASPASHRQSSDHP